MPKRTSKPTDQETRTELCWKLHGALLELFLKKLQGDPEQLTSGVLMAIREFLRDNGITLKKGTPAWVAEEYLKELETESLPFH